MPPAPDPPSDGGDSDVERLRPRAVDPRVLRPRAPWAGMATGPRLLRFAGLLALSVAVSLVGILISAHLRPAASLLAVGSRPPAVDLLGPGPVHADAVAAAAGHPLLIEFFEASCAVCRETAPGLCGDLAAGPDTRVVAVDAALDSGATVDAFRRDRLAGCQSDPRLTVVSDPCRPPGASPCGNVSSRWGVSVVPTVYVVGRDGRLRYAASGADAVQGAAAALATG